MSAIPISDLSSSGSWQENFLRVLPAIETHAKFQFRYLPREQSEDAVQEAVASACCSYQTLAAKGRLAVAHPGTLATYAVSFVRNHRRVGSHQESARDVMSPVCQRRHGVQVVSVDRPQHHARRRDDTDGWQKLAVEDRKASIPDLAAFRIDFEQWLKGQTPRDRRIINAMASGDSTFALATRFGISPGRVSQLRRKFETSWRMFQGEAGDEAA